MEAGQRGLRRSHAKGWRGFFSGSGADIVPLHCWRGKLCPVGT